MNTDLLSGDRRGMRILYILLILDVYLSFLF